MRKIKYKRSYKKRFDDGGIDINAFNPMAAKATGIMLDSVAPGSGSAYQSLSGFTESWVESEKNDLGTVGSYDPRTGAYKATASGTLAQALNSKMNPLSRIQSGLDASDAGANVGQSLLAMAIPTYGEIVKTEKAFAKRKEEEKAEMARLADQKYLQDNASLKGYTQTGSYGGSVYAAKGGLAPLAPGAMEVVGPKHTQGGVNLGNAEVEGGEIVRPQQDGTMQIDSKQMGTADANKPLLERKNLLVKQLEGLRIGVEQAGKMKDLAKNSYSQATVDRNIQKLDLQIKNVTQEIAQIDQQVQANFAQQQQQNGGNGEEETQSQLASQEGEEFARGGVLDNDPDDWYSNNTFNSDNPEADVDDIPSSILDIANPGKLASFNARLGKVYNRKNENMYRSTVGQFNPPQDPISEGATTMTERMFPNGKPYTPMYNRTKGVTKFNTAKAYTRNNNVSLNPNDLSYEDLHADLMNTAGLTDEDILTLTDGKGFGGAVGKTAQDLYLNKSKLIGADGKYLSRAEIFKNYGKSDGSSDNNETTIKSINPLNAEVSKLASFVGPPEDTSGIKGSSTSTGDDEYDSDGDSSNLLNKVGKLGSGLVPYMDIVGNKVLNDKLRKKEIPRPHMLLAPNYNTDYNVNPELSKISRDVNSFNYGVSNNTGSGAVASAYKLASLKGKLDATGKVLNKEQSYELTANAGLARETNHVANQNIQQLNQYNKEKFAKEVQTDYVNPSKNLAKLEDNLQKEISQNRLDENQKEQLAMMKAMYPEQVVASAVSIANSSDASVRGKLNQYLTTPKETTAAISQIDSTSPGWNEMEKLFKFHNINGEYTTKDKYRLIIKDGKVISKTKIGE